MKKIIVLLAIFFAAALLISGCAKVVTCPPNFLVAPSLITPANWSIVDTLSPTFGWSFPCVSYPYPSTGTTCIPEKYKLFVSTGPFFVDNLGREVDGSVTSTTLISDLEPGTEYSWGVRPFSFGEGGPYAGNRYFFTGPVCSADSLVSPVLLEPFNGASVSELNPSLIWDYPDDTCRPDSYGIALSTTADFSDTSLNGGTGNPSTRWGPGDPLTECTTYYWRVTPYVGETAGPVSEAFTFNVNIGGSACTPRTFIAGKVWQEYCAIPDGPLPDPLPFGCVATSGGGATGNGILDPGEPGIKNVIVRLGFGSCPSSNLGVTLTDVNGEYLFEGLEAGTYCLSVDVMQNASTLIPGGFTFPPAAVSEDTAYQEVTIADEDLVVDQNFGWMFQFGPTVPVGEVKGTVWHDECRHTGEVFSAGSEPAGCVISDLSKVRGNGIFEAGEHGIANVWVGLSRTGCYGEPFAWSKTDANGLYHFYVQAGSIHDPVDYCLIVHSESGSNTSVLGEGLWTSPYTTWQPIAKKTVHLSANESEVANIGWDYLHLPYEFIEPLFEYPKFHIDLDTPCYIGPDIRWRQYAALSAGMEFEIEGMDLTHQWLLLTPARLMNPDDFPNDELSRLIEPCWVPIGEGTPSGDLEQVPVREGPVIITFTPTPTATPTAVPDACRKYTTYTECSLHKDKCYWDRTKNVCKKY